MNLREQFLKSGLITKKQASKIEADKKKHEHLLKKDKNLLQSAEAEKQKEAHEFVLEIEKQKQRDLQLNKNRDEILAQREKLYRARQLIQSNAQNKRSASELYFFSENKYVRKVYVTSFQREMLARGIMAIVRPDTQIDEFVILPRETAQILLEICPEKVIVLYSEIKNSEEFVT